MRYTREAQLEVALPSACETNTRTTDTVLCPGSFHLDLARTLGAQAVKDIPEAVRTLAQLYGRKCEDSSHLAITRGIRDSRYQENWPEIHVG